MHSATSGWPQFTQDSEQRRLPATVGTCNHDVHFRTDFETHFFNEHVAVGREDWNLVEDDVFRPHDFGCAKSALHGGLPDQRLGAHVILIVDHHYAGVLSATEVNKHIVHFVYEGCETRQILDILVRDNKSTNCLSQIDKQTTVSDVILSDLSLVVTSLL